MKHGVFVNSQRIAIIEVGARNEETYECSRVAWETKNAHTNVLINIPGPTQRQSRNWNFEMWGWLRGDLWWLQFLFATSNV